MSVRRRSLHDQSLSEALLLNVSQTNALVTHGLCSGHFGSGEVEETEADRKKGDRKNSSQFLKSVTLRCIDSNEGHLVCTALSVSPPADALKQLKSRRLDCGTYSGEWILGAWFVVQFLRAGPLH
jgi:hypothetical protein